MVTDDILRRLRNPELPCICTDVVLLDCHPCNARLDAADEIERLRSEVDSSDKISYDSLRLLYDRKPLDILLYIKKQEAEVTYLRNENQRLREARFDLQAADHIAEAVRDVLNAARRLTDMYRLKEEEKSVPEEYEVFERKEGGQW